MTTWRARKAKRHTYLDAMGRRVLCGRSQAGKYCSVVVAWMVYDPIEHPDEEGRDWVWINHGLTDEDDPGHYRWSTTALERLSSGRAPDIFGAAQGMGGRFAKGPQRVRVPITLPCAKHHENVVDRLVLDA